MKFTDRIKDKINEADSKEEVKTILDNVKGEVMNAGVILDDSDLDQIAGGGATKKSYQKRG